MNVTPEGVCESQICGTLIEPPTDPPDDPRDAIDAAADLAFGAARENR